jgi:hydroxymethylpyrimidine pyrophosphatase-like HAD family hydrolase
MPRYDLLAIDLDGTLLGHGGGVGGVSTRNKEALHRARAAGIRTVICTGRGLAECRHVTTSITQTDPVVVAGGAIIACPETSATLHRFAMPEHVVAQAVDIMLDLDHAALVLKDPVAAGYDYLVVRGPRNIPLDPVTRWWFESMSVRVREVASLDHDEHPEHTVRVGACGFSSQMASAETQIRDRFAHTVVVHQFGAVVAPDHIKTNASGETLHVLEAFDQDATKWSAISHLAKQWGIPASRIAAIGDEINDLSMIEGAGLGIAMGNAIPKIKAIANQHTAKNHEDGVALAIDRIIEGAW